MKKGELYKKGDREVVEIKCDFRSRFEEEVKDVFNPIREKDKDKEKEQAEAFMVASDVFEAPAGKFAPKENEIKAFWKEKGLYRPERNAEAVGLTEKEADNLWEAVSSFTNPAEPLETRPVWGETGMENDLLEIDNPANKGKDASRLNKKEDLGFKYYMLPFGEFLKSLKNAKKDLATLDLTKFEDKGAKVSVDEFLKQPLWTFTVPMNRLPELRKYKPLHWIKISETKHGNVYRIPEINIPKSEG